MTNIWPPLDWNVTVLPVCRGQFPLDPAWYFETKFEMKKPITSCNYVLIINLMHWLLFIHKILISCTCFEPQVLIFRRIQLYTCSIWYCYSLWEFVVVCRYTAWVRELSLKLCTDRPPRTLIESDYHMLHVYNHILLKMSTWGSNHVEEINILWVNNYQCIKLVINI